MVQQPGGQLQLGTREGDAATLGSTSDTASGSIPAKAENGSPERSAVRDFLTSNTNLTPRQIRRILAAADGQPALKSVFNRTEKLMADDKIPQETKARIMEMLNQKISELFSDFAKNQVEIAKSWSSVLSASSAR